MNRNEAPVRTRGHLSPNPSSPKTERGTTLGDPAPPPPQEERVGERRFLPVDDSWSEGRQDDGVPSTSDGAGGSSDGVPHRRWWTVVVFAAAMAWVESAVVFYLRTMINRIEPFQKEPLPVIGSLGPVELAREAATLIMLLTVGMLAGRTWRSRLGYAAVAFGVWDILYYVFLRLMCGRPHGLLDWDILFLLPLPWWGPVLAPMSIALVMIAWGTLATQFQAPITSPPWKSWTLSLLGALLALGIFMEDAFRVAGDGVDAVRNVLPGRFPWLLFTVALLLMSVPVVRLWRQLRLQESPAVRRSQPAGSVPCP